MGEERFGPWLRRQLERREGLTQTEFARRAGVSGGTVSDWLRGRRRPHADLADRIADALGADLDEVLALLGVRPREAPRSDDEARARVVALLGRVDLGRYGRAETLEDMLRGWIRFDREQRGDGDDGAEPRAGAGAQSPP